MILLTGEFGQILHRTSTNAFSLRRLSVTLAKAGANIHIFFILTPFLIRFSYKYIKTNRL